jgi:PTS system nitrogen regulatory IIA component
MNKIDPHFYQFLAEGNIICDLNAESCEEAIAELSARLAKNNAGIDTQEIVEAVIAREKIVPTVIAPGLAVPHARMDNLNQMLVALGTSRKGISFKTPGMPPVNVVIMILTPKDDPGLHLQILAALAKDFKDPESIRNVAASETSGEILNYFTSSDTEIPDYLRAKDVMNSSPVTLLESDTLNNAIEVFATSKVMDVPIMDDEGDIRGAISLEDILKFSLPEHILWMDDLSPILRFQPFAELLREDHETKLADLMRENIISVDQGIPAIQLAKIFLMENVRQIVVTKEGKLAGVVNLQNFITKLFWA